jgi:hypothetical protein
MKLLPTATGLVAMTTGARACIQVHAELSIELGIPDILTVQIWDNGQFICLGGETIWGSSGETRWHVECPDQGYRALLWDNGRSGWVENYRECSFQELYYLRRILTVISRLRLSFGPQFEGN